MGQAALQYARRGWPVFPCRERDEPWRNAAGKSGVFRAKAPYTGQGLKDATRDEERIKAWWRAHPNAMIGLPMGANGAFALDFDPRIEDIVDEDTGEVVGQREYTLEELKAELEAQMGVPLPQSLTAVTQSGGVHVWFRQPDDGGEPIRNRGNLPDHVDVRGLGGYVIAAPSVVYDAEGAEQGRYRWFRGDWRDDAALAPAPPELIEILRSRKRKTAPDAADAAAGAPSNVVPIGRGRAGGAATDEDEALRKYALSALDGECQAIRTAASGKRNAALNEGAFKVATLVAAGVLDEAMALAGVRSAARANPGNDDDHQLEATIRSGWTAGIEQPRDLGEIAAAARSRRERKSPPRSSRPAPPAETENGEPSSHGGGKRVVETGKGQGAALTRECAFLPQTDLGNLERFLKRHGRDFLFVEAWGWLAWDGRRWNRDMALPLLGRAIQETMRAIQEEAEFVRASGVPFPPEGGFVEEPDDDGDDDDDMFARSKGEKERRRRKSVLWFRQRQLARQSQNSGERLDSIVQIKSSGEIVLYSDKVAAWGRTSEGAGHIKCIAGLAEARLSARPDDFDVDPLKLNVANGTLVFERDATGGDARVRFDPEHRREDLITKIAAVSYDPAATSPKYDAFIAEVQPQEEMREFLDIWAGYNSLGLADAQKMAVFYGQGSNGKGVWTNTIAAILGDYAWAAAIETFIDQGKYRKGSDASPDLAALAGRRMVYANEPEEGSKFSDGLIKSMTSDEPIGGVRELMKPPFQLLVTFTNTVSANHRPKIGTDHGIQRRVQIVPWDVIIPNDRADPMLKAKLKAEASGILNRMVRGALRYLTRGLPMPEAIREATREYQEENDILGQFLALAVAKVPGNTVGATPFHKAFAGWQTWAGQLPASGKAWSMKHLNGQMQKKGYKITKSSTMQWQDIALRYDEGDFLDMDGKPVTRPLRSPTPYPGDPDPPPHSDAPPAPSNDWGDDDLAP